VYLSRCSCGVGDDDQRVDFEVCELAVDVNSVQSCDEVNKDIVDTLGNLLQERCSKFLVRRVLGKVNGNENLLGFGIDITNVDTSLVCEEDPIALKGEDMVSTWHVIDTYSDWRKHRLQKKINSRLARTNGGDSGNYQAHADTGPKMHVDSMGFGRDVGLLKCDPWLPLARWISRAEN
jgi:hypothetical protein